MKFFKHKSEVKISKHKDVEEYLFNTSVQSSGAINYDDNERLVVPQNDKKYAIFKVEYINPNGIDDETDIENRNKVNELFKAMLHEFKIVDMNVIKNELDTNVEDYLSLLERADISEKRKQKIQDRLDVMNYYNDERYVTSFLYVSLADLDMFSKLAPTVFHVERLNYDGVVEVLSNLNNDME